MKNTRNYLFGALILILGFVFGLCFDKIVNKSFAAESDSNELLPTEKAFETLSSGSARAADYEIISVYGNKYIIFSSGGDIEVLNY